MTTVRDWVDRRFYPGQTYRTQHERFRVRVLELMKEDSVVLDFGAGRGALEEMNFHGLAGQVCGVDIDSAVLQNPYLDDGRVIEDDRIPYPDEYFDLVFSSYVMEHVERPDRVFAEIGRVLRPGGRVIWRSPNRFHYVAVIASLTPHWFHQWVNSKRGREHRDTFPTVYRVNTVSSIRKCAKNSGFEVERILCDEGRPEYTRLTVPTYMIGILYERIVNSSEVLSRLRSNFTVTMRKTNPTEANNDPQQEGSPHAPS